MKVEIKKKNVCVVQEMVVIDGLEVEVYDFLGCLDVLEDTDGTFTFVTIPNVNMEKILLKYKLAYKDNRGTWAQYLNTGRIARFKKKINKALIEMRKRVR